jgi:GT2 family glycosyltransferase/glycosyltransferase involved in cell wall biosynthesis
VTKVSIYLSSYNHAKYLREAIDSVLNQTFSDYQLFIEDDTSTDESWFIIQSYTDPRIRSFRNSKNRNDLEGMRKVIFQMATGEYIAIHHSDDIWEPEKLQKQVDFLDAHPQFGAVFTNAKIIDEDGKRFKDKSHFYYKIFDQPNRDRFEWLNFFFYQGNALCHPSVLIRKSCYNECGFYRDGLNQLGDFDMWVRLCLKYEIHVIPEKLVRFRVRSNEMNTSGNRPEVRIRGQFEFLQLLDNYLKIATYQEFVKIFPAAQKYYRQEGFDIAYVLGMVVLERANDNPIFSLFGLKQLFEAINDPERSRRIDELYGFSQKDFIALTAKYDVFSIEFKSSFYPQLAEKEQLVQVLTAQLTDREHALQTQLEEREQAAQALQTQLEEREQAAQALHAQLEERDQVAQALHAQLEEREQAAQALQTQLEEREQVAQALHAQLTEREQVAQALQAQLEEREQAAQALHAQLVERDQKVTALDSRIFGLQQEFTGLKDHINQREQILQDLNSKLLEIYNSTAWKIIQWMWRLRLWLVPNKSWQERTLKKIYSYIRVNNQDLKYEQELEMVKNSGLFDQEWYLVNYPDVANSGTDPASHYLLYGGFEGRDPGPNFSSSGYLSTHNQIITLKVNPLVHYLKSRGQNKFVIKSKLWVEHPAIVPFTDMLLSAPYIPPVSIAKPIDILIPVFNGGKYLSKLLQSIVNNTNLPYRLLIGNDKSTDPEISEYLENFKNQNSNLSIIIIENKENLGYVRTVNKLAKHTNYHFVILNSDTEVPPQWLERLIYPIVKIKNVASATPFTNAGTIFSFPNFFKDNPIFENLDINKLDSFFSFVNFEMNYLEVPTGVGFCMAINKRVYDVIGLFDEDFDRGYGEENDWCMRALKEGYKNLIVPNLFVYHKHGGSFSSEERSKLQQVNTEKLRAKHPDYSLLAGKFIDNDPLRPLRNIIKAKILSTLFRPALIIDHSLGGGANEYTKTLISKQSIAILVRFDIGTGNYTITFSGQKTDEISFETKSLDILERIIDEYGVENLIINELVSYRRVLELLDYFVKLKEDRAYLKLTVMLHDFFSVCPMYNLIGYECQYCGVPSNTNYCDKCLQINPLIKQQVSFVQSDYPNLSISLWRQKFYKLLELTTNIICFSESSKEILQKAHPNLPDEKFEIIPHQVDWVRPVLVNKVTDEINIAILGQLTVHKGVHIVAALASYIDYHNLPIKIHHFGVISEPYEHFSLFKSFVKHGKYEKELLSELMESNEIDVILISSICPETFSYTTEEAIKMELPVIGFDVGAPAERIMRYEKGVILQEKTAEYIVRVLLNRFFRGNAADFFIQSNRENEDIVLVCVSNNDFIYSRLVLSSAYMTEHKILLYDNTDENLPIPVRYNHAIRSLLSSKYKGWIIFIHNDFSILEPIEKIVGKLSHHSIYGPIGATFVNGEKILYGQILQGHNEELIRFGSLIEEPCLVDTVDCQCVICHTDILSEIDLRFDENDALAFHQYVEEFCLNAKAHGIDTFAVPIKCKHISWGKVDDKLIEALNYISTKYYPQKWAGTCTQLDSYRLNWSDDASLIRSSALFDEAWYLANNPDVAHSKTDAALHYLHIGGFEGRDPGPDFSSSFYLAANKDVEKARINPLVHYLKSGITEGRPPKLFTPLIPNIDERYDKTLLVIPDRLLSSSELINEFQQNINHDYIISISHDTYINNIGGVQLNISNEQIDNNAKGIGYIHLYPLTPKPTLARDNEPFFVGINLNGKYIGVTNGDILLRALKQLSSKELANIYIHHTMGFDLNLIYQLLKEIGNNKGRFWLHDLFSICPNYTLMRNDKEYCGAPDIDSNSCNICGYSKARRKQQAEFFKFFSETELDIRAPSTYSLKFWKEKVLPAGLSGMVTPHTVLTWNGRIQGRNVKKPIRIGFVGFPFDHKGWQIWLKLLENNSNDKRYEFYHFSSKSGSPGSYKRIEVSVTSKNQLAMVDALRNNQIDVAFLWSLCPETFSYTLYESLAAGCYIITNQYSGNIQDYLNQNPDRGVVLENEQQLFKLFSGKDLNLLVTNYQRDGKPQAEITFLTGQD